ncbi:Uridine kinase [C1] [hydrothermal vent metagenome]|uniref:uridine/cytidine kinase n=1 Tax=hydrothermal vent metagenome TaxID=652676 RepID=A0A1W1EDJ3_9ZZZZ
MKKYIFVGVAGGSGSGKTTVANNLIRAFRDQDAVLIQQDSYYKEIKNKTIDERAQTNFDHPDAIEFELLREHLLELKDSNSIDKPIYNFSTHLREEEKEKIEPSQIIIVEGILVLAVPEIRDLLDMKIFVDTDADEMLLRRVERDINERGRTYKSVKEQYLNTVKPMYLKFCEPSKRYADIIIPRGGENEIAIDMVISKLKTYL